jgi:hypothetical protein
MADELARIDDDINVYREAAPIADDTLIAIAKMAEARIDAVIKIKQLALKVTNPQDWTDQQGKPYLQVSGAEKIANLFNISWSFLTSEPLFELDPDGHYTFTFKGRFSMGGRSIEVEGSRSSRDSFFKQNIYKDGKLEREKAVDERDNKRDVKMAALTNMLGNGITRILGIRNLTWEDLEKFAGIKKEDVGKVEYKSKGTPKPPQEKGAEDTKDDEKKRGEIVDLAALYAGGKKITVGDAMKEFTAFTGSDGTERYQEDPKKLHGKWLNSTLGKARELAKPFLPPEKAAG